MALLPKMPADLLTGPAIHTGRAVGARKNENTKSGTAWHFGVRSVRRTGPLRGCPRVRAAEVFMKCSAPLFISNPFAQKRKEILQIGTRFRI